MDFPHSLREVDAARWDKSYFDIPYPYLQVKNFLADDDFDEVASSLDQSIDYTYNEEFKFQHTYFHHLPLLKIMYHPGLFAEFKKIFGFSFTRKKDAFPEVRRLAPSGTKGFNIHNDQGFIGHVVVLYYLTEYQAGRGGEILIYDRKFNVCNEIIPHANSLLVMPILNEYHFHSVRPTKEGYDRIMGFFPMTIKEFNHG